MFNITRFVINHKISTPFSAYIVISVFLITMMLMACRPDIKTINVYGSEDTLPELTAYDIAYTRSDSGDVQAVLTSPLMFQYTGDDPHFIFPDGFKVVFYDSLMNISSSMTANYGIGYDKQKIMEARDNVVIINFDKNERLDTQHLIWDQRKKKIYSQVQVCITTPDEIIYGDGLTSDESFDKYEILHPSGVFEVEDDEK